MVAGAVAGTVLSSADGVRAAVAPPATEPFPLSVMLWTIYRDLPFEQRLEKVAQAGYRAVELVGEFKIGRMRTFRRPVERSAELGITFDATAGLHRSLCDPAERAAFLDELRAMLPTMDKLECSKPSCVMRKQLLQPLAR